MTTSTRVVLVLFGFSLISLAITGSEVYSRLSYLWGFLLAGNCLWSASSLQGHNVNHRPRIRRAHRGQIFEEQFDIENHMPLAACLAGCARLFFIARVSWFACHIPDGWTATALVPGPVTVEKAGYFPTWTN